MKIIRALILKSLWFLTPVSGTYIGTLSMAHPFRTPAHSYKKLWGEGKWASVTEWRLAVRAGSANILTLGAPDSSIRHRCIWCSVKSSRRNVFDIVQNCCTDGTQITLATHSSKFGSRPSETILFLMAMTGTPCNRQKAWWNATFVKFSPII